MLAIYYIEGINFRPKKCSGQSRYGCYGSYATDNIACFLYLHTIFRHPDEVHYSVGSDSNTSRGCNCDAVCVVRMESSEYKSGVTICCTLKAFACLCDSNIDCVIYNDAIL